MTSRLAAFVAEELDRPVASAIAAFAAEIAARGGAGVVGVLFYGSALRTGATDGLLDFYVLLDDLEAWPARPLLRWGNRQLPPNVEYAETTAAGMTLRSKFAVMTLDQFRRHARALSRDTTIWARFAQPCGLVFRRDEAAGAAIADAVAGAVRGAAWWAARLGPKSGTAAAFWSALFSRTYASELRVEGASRPGSIVDAAPGRYAEILRLAWEADGLAFDEQGDDSPSPLRGGVRGGGGPGKGVEGDAALRGTSAPRSEPPPPLTPPHKGEGDKGGAMLRPHVSDRDRADAERAWRTRQRLAKPLNLLRLAKAAFTFSGGADYIAWKIERHTGQRFEVTPFQRRHPLLSAGPVLWRLWRRGVLR